VRWCLTDKVTRNVTGKSTTADQLCEMIVRLGRFAAVLPMDGFHYDDAVVIQP